MQLQQLNMAAFGLPQTTLIRDYTAKPEPKPFDAKAWHDSLNGEWLPDWQGPVQPQTSEPAKP